jgi:hypothetical protein
MMTADGLSFGGHGGDFEVRQAGDGATRLRGRFPYRRRAVLSDGGRRGRPEKEEFDANAFAFRVNDPEAEIHLLVGHRFDKPLASKLSGTLTLRDTAAALLFEAVITRAISETTFGRDALALLFAGLATGISPGFRLPPERAVPRQQAETIIQEPVNPDEGMMGAEIRIIHEALLFELSLVTMPAYPDAQVEARMAAPVIRPNSKAPQFLRRWRY